MSRGNPRGSQRREGRGGRGSGLCGGHPAGGPAALRQPSPVGQVPDTHHVQGGRRTSAAVRGEERVASHGALGVGLAA